MVSKRKKITPSTLSKMKKKGEKIIFLTAYDFFTARSLDSAGIEGLLVGDSMNMVVYGKSTTLSATMDQMLKHVEAVANGTSLALVVADMPFLSYQPSDADAIRNAGLFLKCGAEAVKLEGGIEMAERIKKITDCGIPVMGHLGLTPQSINKFGGYRIQGKTVKSQDYLLESAKALQAAGCFAIVLEAIKNKIAAKITQSIKIPTIGIGAGAETDGQIMVINDIMGMDEAFHPRFVRRYFNLGEKLTEVGKQFSDDVKSGNYPTDEETYG